MYRDLVLPESTFIRILEAAEQQRLPLLASLDQYGSQELDKVKALSLAEEVTLLRSSGGLPDLDDDLTSLAEVARWCARSREDAWLKIEGPRVPFDL